MATLTLVTSIVSVVGLAISAPAAAFSPPIPCSVSTAYLGMGTQTSGTTLFAESFGAGAATFTAIGAQATQTYNAIGVNPLDGYIYATGLIVPDILRIDPTTGVVTDLGPTTPALSGTFWNVGVFDTAGNYYTLGDDQTTMNVVNVNTLTRTALTLSQAPIANDLSFGPGGFLWGATGIDTPTGSLVRVNVATGQVDFFPGPTSLPTGNQYGATFTYGNGNIGLGYSGGGLYAVSIANPSSASPTFTVVSTQTTAPSANNDGTSCISPPVDLQIVKTGPTTILPGATFQWQLTITNNSTTSPSSGYTVTDPVPAGYTAISATPGCTIVGQNINCTGGELDAGDSAVITVTATAPTTPGCYTNTAMVLGNEGEPLTLVDAADNSSSLQTCAETAADLATTKTLETINGVAATPTSTAKAGDVLSYDIQVVNSGGQSGMTTLTDDVPANTTYTGSAGGQGWSCPAPSPAGTVCTQAVTVAGGATEHVAYTVTVVTPIPVGTTTIANVVTSSVGTCLTCSPGIPAALPDLAVTKSVDPVNGSTVVPGQTLTYTLTFVNSGTAVATVASTDTLTDVLDDATLTSAPALASGTGLTVGAISAGAFAVTGSLAAGATATVTYTVMVNSPDTGNQVLKNYVEQTGTVPPTTCASGDPTCTSNPVQPPASALAFTGLVNLPESIGGGLGLLILGAMMLLAGARRQCQLARQSRVAPSLRLPFES